MFFHIDEEMLRKIKEATEKATQGESTAEPKFIVQPDGSLIINDPALVTVVTSSPGFPSSEELEKVSFLHPKGVWVPFPIPPETPSSETPPDSSTV